MKRLLTALVGAVVGYIVFCGGLLFWVAWRAIQRHYFDTEELLYGFIYPVGAVPTFFTGEWRQYPGWANFRNVFAYSLMVCGAIVAWRHAGRGDPPSPK